MGLRGGGGAKQLAATNQLKNLRVQVESRLEMAMSDRFLTFLDLDVKAPLLVIPVDLSGGSGGGRGPDQDKEGGAQAASERGVAGEEEIHVFDEEGGEESQGRPSGGVGKSNTPNKKAGAVAVVAREMLVVDLGSVSLTTDRLAQHFQRKADKEGTDGFGTTTTTSSSNGGGGNEMEVPSSSSLIQGKNGFSVPGAGGGGFKRQRATGESWHAKFYDVYRVEVHRVGVLLLAGRESRSGDGGEEEVAKRWLVNPFDVKVSSSTPPTPPRF